MNDFMILIKQMIIGHSVSLFFNEPQTNGRVEWICEEWSYETGRRFFICDYGNEYYERYSPGEMYYAFSCKVAAGITITTEYPCIEGRRPNVVLDILTDAQSEIAPTLDEKAHHVPDNIPIQPVNCTKEIPTQKVPAEPIKNNCHLKLLKFVPRETAEGSNPLYETMTFSEARENWGLGKSTLRMMVRTDRLKKGKDYRKSGSQWLITRRAMIMLYGEPKKEEIKDSEEKNWNSTNKN